MYRKQGILDPEKYLAGYEHSPYIEKFAKAGLARLVNENLSRVYWSSGYRDDSFRIDRSQTSLTKMLGISTEELRRLRYCNGGKHMLLWLQYEKAIGKPIPDDTIKWLLDNKMVPNCIENVITEGRSLHHCVDKQERYWERIERNESYIFFLRRTAQLDQPYYTLEVEPGGTIRQKRTMYDRQEDDIEDAKGFLIKWQLEIKKRLTDRDRSLAEKSRILRLENFKQLQKDNVIINTGHLHGAKLVDVLMADLMVAA